MNLKAVERKPGRPKAIPEALIPKVLSLYHQGLGYRAVARELRLLRYDRKDWKDYWRGRTN